MSFDYHMNALSKLCRICGNRLLRRAYGPRPSEMYRRDSKPLPVTDYRKEIDAVWGINVWKDTAACCPQFVCSRCGRAIRHQISGTRVYGRRTAHPCIAWEDLPHSQTGQCLVCTNFNNQRRGRGGRASWPARNSTEQPPTSVAPIPLPFSLTVDNIFPSQVSLLPAEIREPPGVTFDIVNNNSLVEEISQYTCIFCLCILSSPVEAPCHHNFCAQCLTKYFQFHRSSSVACPICKTHLNFEAIQQSPVNIIVTLPNLPMMCTTCGAIGTMKSSRGHKCPRIVQCPCSSCHNGTERSRIQQSPPSTMQYPKESLDVLKR